MADIKTIFGAIDHLDTYQRVNSTHLLDLYVGIDAAARWTLLLISEYPPMKVTSSRMILVKSGRRPDKKWSLSFSLIEAGNRCVFLKNNFENNSLSGRFENGFHLIREVTHFVDTFQTCSDFLSVEFFSRFYQHCVFDFIFADQMVAFDLNFFYQNSFVIFTVCFLVKMLLSYIFSL